MKTLLILWGLTAVLLSCDSSNSSPNPSLSTPDSSLQEQVNVVDAESVTCLDDIYVALGDSVLVYYASISKDSFSMQEHAGNSRLLITKGGKLYYSSNKGAISDLNNYFNKELFLFKTLSSSEIGLLIDSLNQWGVSDLPAYVDDPNKLFDGGSSTYFYFNPEDNSSCTHFDVGHPMVEKIENLLKAIQ